MKKIYLLSAFLFFTYTFIYSQNVEGKWVGYLDQSADAAKTPGYEAYYKNGLWEKGKITHILTLTFIQKENNFIGEYFIQTRTDTTNFAKFKLSGTIDKEVLEYKTTRKTEEAGSSYCYNKAKLIYYVKDNYEYLEGEWTGWDELGRHCASAYIVVRRIKIQPEIKNQESVEIKKEEPLSEKQPQKIENREPVIINKTFTTTKEFVTVNVWDANTVDGDIISLNLNGKWVLENFEVTKKKKEIVLQLDPGTNYLLLHAINLGRIPPNTAALSITDGQTKERVVLNSDLNTSQGFKIIKQ